MGLTSSRGKAAGAVALFDNGNEVVFDELAGGIADQAFVFGEQGVELDEINAAEFHGHGGTRFLFPGRAGRVAFVNLWVLRG